MRRSEFESEMRRINDRIRGLGELTAAKSALHRRLQLASLYLRRRAELIEGLLERTLAEQAEFDKEPLPPRGFIADPCDIHFKKVGELRVHRRMRRIGVLYSMQT